MATFILWTAATSGDFIPIWKGEAMVTLSILFLYSFHLGQEGNRTPCSLRILV